MDRFNSTMEMTKELKRNKKKLSNTNTENIEHKYTKAQGTMRQ